MVWVVFGSSTKQGEVLLLSAQAEQGLAVHGLEVTAGFTTLGSSSQDMACLGKAAQGIVPCPLQLEPGSRGSVTWELWGSIVCLRTDLGWDFFFFVLVKFSPGEGAVHTNDA